jgi:hypothetical protein
MRAYLLPLLLSAACSKDAPPEPATYTYRVWFETGSNAEESAHATRPASLLVNGEKVVSDEIAIKKDVKLADPATKFVATTTSTCGTTEHELVAFPEYDTREETTMRGEARRYSGQAIKWKVGPKGAWPKYPHHMLYVDNLDGQQPAVIHVGKSEITVDAKSSSKAGVDVGDCPEGRQVTIDGRPVGELEAGSEGPTLVDVGGGHCYVLKTASYGPRGLEPPPDRFYGVRDNKHLVPATTVDNVFVANAATTTTTVRAEYAKEDAESAGEWRTSLTRFPCNSIPKQR